jgi:CheY-like chemotaxis protein
LGLRHLPSLALTAYATHSDRERALEAGFDAYLPKPVAAPELMETIMCLAERAAVDPATPRH